MNKEFSFIIARKWIKKDPVTFPNLAIYQYFEQVHTGSLEFARELLAEIKSKNPGKEYKIYPVSVGEAIE
jgi:hypothetical protein